MKVTKDTPTILELTFDGVRARLRLLAIAGCFAPLVGVVILAIRRDVPGIFLSLLCLSSIYLLFTSITTSCILDKDTGVISFVKSRPFGKIISRYNIGDLEEVNIIKDSGWRYITFNFRNGIHEATVPNKQEDLLKEIVNRVNLFLST